ncbi:MAG: ABC transporter ATP-binding protein [Cyanobacteria bacterium P01_A01_bin.84]
MSDTVIRVNNLSKKYILRHQQEGRKYKALRDVIVSQTKYLGKKLFAPKSKLYNSQREEFWALQDISFEIKQGDRVGIIGRNGAGKSTLLKILSRITEPSRGKISIKGRVASLLEVGTGFHPELTGRENIYLNGAILGMSKAEIKFKFDEIVDFAEVEQFLDTPVKRYSSGMYVRLAFAVAAHLEPEILIIDEVLAVGDTSFQKKCLSKMKEVSSSGRTVLFVSHNMAAIRSLCSEALLLNQGKIVAQGSTDDCITSYEIQNSQNIGQSWKNLASSEKSGLVIENIQSRLTSKQPNLTLELKIILDSRTNHKPAFIAVDILDAAGTAIMQALPSVEGFIKYVSAKESYFQESSSKHLVKLYINLPPLIPGLYLASIWVGSHNTETLDEVKEAINFEVCDSPTPGRTFPHHVNHGHIVPISRFEYSLYS